GRRPIRDSSGFRTALRIWGPIVRSAQDTPRFIKRYKNRLRYLAMRLRPLPVEDSPLERLLRRRGAAAGELAAPSLPSHLLIPEPHLVALSALRLIDGRLVEPGPE